MMRFYRDEMALKEASHTEGFLTTKSKNQSQVSEESETYCKSSFLFE